MKTKIVVTFLTLLLLEILSLARAGILTGPVTNPANGHIYFLLSSNTWTGSEAEAVGLGGHLVTVSDSDENHWVFTNFTTFGGVQRPLWIGLYQPNGSVEPASGWSWISGESVNYTNWTTGEPNNNTNHGPQNWAMIWPPDLAGRASPYQAEHWNDYWNTDHVLDSGLTNLHWGMYGVVEIVPPVPRLTISRQPLGVGLSWDSQTNRTYQMQYISDLSTNDWTNLGLSVPGNGTTNSITDPIIDPRRFYRIAPFP